MSDNSRLSMLDEFGGRKAIIPAEVNGRYRKAREKVYWVLLAVFLILPWIQIGGLQAVLLDIPSRRFEFFGMLLLAHDTPLLFLLVATFVLGLAFVTSIWGRVWCGWACPQTVFIEAVYRQIERWIEGGYIERRRLNAAAWSLEKLRKRATKWFLFTVVSSVFAHSLIAYFAGSRDLLAMMRGSPGENWTYFLLVTSITGLLLFNFGWFREQFCIVMCPYGRLQGVLMDAKSKTIHYDKMRGEPRRSKAPAGARGACISCNRCVEVCPTGIDIRNGVQMDCIGCTACIDACDDIMAKVKQPPRLIAYRTPGRSRALSKRPRPLVYLGLAIATSTALILNLAIRPASAVTVLRAKDTPYQKMDGGLILNHFKAHLINQSRESQEFTILLSPTSEAAGVVLKQADAAMKLNPGQAVEAHFFLLVPQSLFDARGEWPGEVQIVEKSSGKMKVVPVRTVGPYSSTGS